MINAALVLEGGSLRTLFTSGVLDVFMQNNLEFACVIGASAGALNGANYVAKHIGRSARINTIHSNDANYFGLKQLVTKRNAFNFDYLFGEPINHLYPYDEAALANSKQRFLIAATDCETGGVTYFERRDYQGMAEALQASSSIPMLNKFVYIDGKPYTDGGVAEAIGLHKAVQEGYDRIVLVLTRDIGFRKSGVPKLQASLYRRAFDKYPELIEALMTIPDRYNALVEEIQRLERAGKIFVVRPRQSINIKVMERDARKLLDLYFRGRDEATALLPQMQEYIYGRSFQNARAQ